MILPAATLSARSWWAESASSKICSISSLVRSAMEMILRQITVFLSSARGTRPPGGQSDLVDAIRFLEHDVDPFAFAGIDIFPDNIRSDGELSRPSIHQRGDQNSLWLSEPRHRLHCGSNRPATENDIVHQNHGLLIH